MCSEFSTNNWEKDKYKLLKEFDVLLDSIDSSNSKEKILWKQIYDNSISDRNSANLCFMDLFPHIKSSHENHAIMGDKLANYLTRMEKSNEQLLKLSSLIRKAIESNISEGDYDEDELLGGTPTSPILVNGSEE